MGLDLWFRDDVIRILASTHETMRASTGSLPALDSEQADAYQRGFVDALRVVGIAFGVAAPQSRSGQRRINGPTHWKER